MFRRPFSIISAVCLALVAALLAPATVHADNDTWKDGTSGYFDDDGRWTDGTAPAEGDTVKFGIYDAYEVLWGASTGNRTTQSMALTDDDVTFRISDSPSSPYTWTITDRGNADATVTGGTLTLGGASDTGGLTRFLVFFVIDLATRKVEIASVHVDPCQTQMLQYARNLTAFAFVIRGGGHNAKRVSSSRFALRGCGVREDL